MDDHSQINYLKEVNDFSDLFYNKNNTKYADIKFQDFNHYQEVYNNYTFTNNSLNKNNINNIMNWLKEQHIINKEFKDHIKNEYLVSSGVISLDESFNIFNIYLLSQQQQQQSSTSSLSVPTSTSSSSPSSSLSPSQEIKLPNYININNITKSMKYFSVVYFLIYHQSKMAHYIFQDYFINYVACIFFDQDIEIFALLKFLNIMKTGKSFYNLLNIILFDPKLNSFIKNNKNQLLKEKIQILFNLIDNKHLFDKLALMESNFKLNNNQIEFINILKHLLDNKKNNGIIISNNASNDLDLKTIDYQKKRNYDIKELQQQDNSKSLTNDMEICVKYYNHNIYLNNIILGKIFDYIIYNDNRNNNNNSNNNSINNKDKFFYDRDNIAINISYGLVSKRLFGIFSKVISNYSFPIFNKINYNSEYCLIKHPLIYLNYESIKYLPTQQIEHSFSRVEELFIRLDNNQQTERQYLEGISYLYKTRYLERDYLIYPPPIPKLKKLIVSNYYGYNNISNAGFYNRAYNQINSNDLITHIVSNSSQSIKYFTITIIRNFQHDANIPFIYDFSFFTHLLKHHSQSLKEISIHFSLNFTPRTVESANFLEYYFSDYPHIKIKFITNDESIPSTFKKNVKKYFNSKLTQEQVINNITYYKSNISV